MKKVLFSLLAMAGLLIVTTAAQAQSALKIGIFDTEQVMRALPEFRNVDSLVQIYQRDSIGGQYDILQSDLHRLDSTLHADSIAKKSDAVLKYSQGQRQQVVNTLLNWNQIAQQASQSKYVQLAQPLYIKVSTAFQKIVTERHITLVLRPDAIEGFADPKVVEDLREPVARALGIPINNTEAAPASTGTQPSTTPARKPATPARRK